MLDISGIMYLSESGLFPEIGRFTAFNDVLISLKSILADPRKERFCFESEKNPLCLLGGDEKNPRIIRKSTDQIHADIGIYNGIAHRDLLPTLSDEGGGIYL